MSSYCSISHASPCSRRSANAALRVRLHSLLSHPQSTSAARTGVRVMSRLSISSVVRLNNGVNMPQLGLGTYLTEPSDIRKAISVAYSAGYSAPVIYDIPLIFCRHIDTAAFYQNEKAIGEAIRDLRIPRESIFVCTKIWYSEHGYEKAKAACRAGLERLGLEYVDLMLIHHPDAGTGTAEGNNQRRLQTWKAMEEFMNEGKAKAIGVSNYTIRHLDALIPHVQHVPAVNQVEMHPLLTQQELLQYCRKHGIQLVAYSPFGKGRLLRDPNILKVAAKYKKTAAQILVRWPLQQNVVVIPKSDKEDHIRQNADVYDFEISQEDMDFLTSLNKEWHCTWDPTNVL